MTRRRCATERTNSFALPAYDDLRVTGALALGFAIFWIVVYGGASWMTSLHSARARIHMGWELAIPFVTGTALLYLSLIPLMLLSLFVFRTWQKITPLLVVLVAQTLIALPFFLFLPIEQAFPRPTPDGLFSGLFRFADFINLEGNYFPSLHVSYAFTTAMAIGRLVGRPIRAVFVFWAACIAISTLLLHQHYVADVLGGILLSWLTMRWLYYRSATPEFLRALRAEMICLTEFYRFSRRHRRYLLIGAIVYIRSLLQWRRMRPIRVGFCFLQHIDDVLDGDRPCPVEPAELVDDVLAQLERESFDDTAVGCLVSCLWEDMSGFQVGTDDPRAELAALIRRMQHDRFRVRDGLILSAEELLAHQREVFHHSVNLMLMLGGAELRADDAPDLIEAFGWCSTIRDFREDIEKGLVNIPASVIRTARSQGLDSMEYEALASAPAVKLWMSNEYRRAARHLALFENEMPKLKGRKGLAVLRLFHGSICRYAKAASKTYG